MTPEQGRLNEARTHAKPWKKWGPYLSERQWGTVREDYSQQSGDSICVEADSWYFPYMSRLARMVVPDLPHHVTQRGNRREPIFSIVP